MALVYLHTNKITKQKYIGITNYDDAEKRWREGKGYETQYFGKAGIGVYGWDGFTHEVLADHIDNETAATIECFLIKELETTNPKYGYNTSEGKIFPNKVSEAKEIIEKILKKNPNVLRRTKTPDNYNSILAEITLDPVQIKTVKANTSISNWALGAVGDYFDDFVVAACLVTEKTNNSFLILLDKKFAFVDKGEIYIYPFESCHISGQWDKYDIKTETWRYKSVEVIDQNSIKPTIIITGTIANMKEFPTKLVDAYEKYIEELRLERQRKERIEKERLERIEAEKERDAILKDSVKKWQKKKDCAKKRKRVAKLGLKSIWELVDLY